MRSSIIEQLFHPALDEFPKLLIKPSKANIKVFLEEIKRIIQSSGALPTEILIHRLNQKITGWTNYYRGVVSSKVFATIDEEIFKALKRWGLKRHSNKGKPWIMRKYYTSLGDNNWRFHCIIKEASPEVIFSGFLDMPFKLPFCIFLTLLFSNHHPMNY